MLHADCHTRLANLETLRAEWCDAVDRTTESRFAAPSLDWYLDALHGSATAVEPLVMIATADETLLGIVPFVVERKNVWPGVSVRVVGFASSGGTARCAIPGPHPGTALATALRTLAGRRDWDVLRLDDPNRRPRTRTALRLARMRFDQHVIAAERATDPGAPCLRVFDEDDTGSVADRYVSWRRRSSLRTWAACRDGRFRHWLEAAPLVVDLAPATAHVPLRSAP